jgi:4-hydroxyphenylpyruvate dioxygenase
MVLYDNPCNLDGFAFLEFSSVDEHVLENQFSSMGFHIAKTYGNNDIVLYEQGDIKFYINKTTDSQAFSHAKVHGPGACAMGFKVLNAEAAFNHAIKNGATEFIDTSAHKHNLRAINAIGGSVIYLVDDNTEPFGNNWIKNSNQDIKSHETGLKAIDHLTHNVFRGNMDKWAEFYEKIFNFREIRFFNIVGKMTGLISRALSSPCNKIKIPLNESKDDLSQIEEFLHDYNGEGIQHVALTTDDIYKSVGQLRHNKVRFLDVPDTYYEMINNRVPWHTEPIAKLQDLKLLIDGEKDPNLGLLLQIFTENAFGPVFFEIIQRKGNQGFGEGNFQALFEAIERDQVRRGTL